MPTNRKLIILTGPTAVGKTTLSIQLAQALNTEIISCDSRQIYKEMTIGTAKPSISELNQVPHHFINNRSVEEGDYTAGDFESDCDKLLNQLFQKHNYVIMTGGTGLYIKAVINGLDKFPEIPVETRNEFNELFNREGIEALQSLIQIKDPEYYDEVDKNNPRRLIRALEIIETSGKKYSELRKGKKKKLNYEYDYFILNRDRNELYQRINLRVEDMIKSGLEDEARLLHGFKNLKALKTVGYQEIFNYLDEQWSLDFAIDKIKQHSRNYAKRQLTWFRKIDKAKWLDANKTTFENILKQL